jgi:hypothetical protein
VFFKKKKIHSKTSKSVPYILSIIGVIGIFFLAISVVRAVNEINFRIFEFGNTPTGIFDFSYSGEKADEQSTPESMIYILITGK